MSQPETKLRFLFLAAQYTDAGIESIHFGQVEIMNDNDPDLTHWSHMLDLVCTYAAKHARRGMVLCNAHVPSGGQVRHGKLLFDFHCFPIRPKEIPDKPQEAILEMGYNDSLYGRSKGGKTFSGWSCEHLPYIVEFDMWGNSSKPGQPGSYYFVWGYDEMTWLGIQKDDYRRQWLRYAWDWVRKNDPNGYVEMPGMRGMAGNPLNRRRYYANNPSPAVPDGFGDERTIRAIWAADSETR